MGLFKICDFLGLNKGIHVYQSQSFDQQKSDRISLSTKQQVHTLAMTSLGFGAGCLLLGTLSFPYLVQVGGGVGLGILVRSLSGTYFKAKNCNFIFQSIESRLREKEQEEFRKNILNLWNRNNLTDAIARAIQDSKEPLSLTRVLCLLQSKDKDPGLYVSRVNRNTPWGDVETLMKLLNYVPGKCLTTDYLVWVAFCEPDVTDLVETIEWLQTIQFPIQALTEHAFKSFLSYSSSIGKNRQDFLKTLKVLHKAQLLRNQPQRCFIAALLSPNLASFVKVWGTYEGSNLQVSQVLIMGDLQDYSVKSAGSS